MFCENSKLQNVAMIKNTTKSKKGSKTLVLIIDEGLYDKFLNDSTYARIVIDRQILDYPDLFPSSILKGYILNGHSEGSKKMDGLRKRKFFISGQQYHLHPSFVLPDMRGKSNGDAYYALWLRKYHVPYWLLVELYGRNVSYWWRLETCLSVNSIVGTTVYGKATDIPPDLVVDEHHVKVNREKHYVATTVGSECLLGAEVSRHCNEAGLTAAYGVFQKEAKDRESAYAPSSINTDGWKATVKAMKVLFPMAVLVRCFLHAFLKVKTCTTKKTRTYFDRFADMIWGCYRAEGKRSFSQRLRRIREKVIVELPKGKLKDAILSLCAKKDQWTTFYACPSANRTSNMLDRLMRFMDRHIFIAQGFHGSQSAANKGMRAFCLLYNFAPSSPKVRKNGLISPAARLNGFVYSENWLENFLVAATLNGKKSQSH